ncbi:unnamed protein product [Callosobruchus maculatus]|uniref:Lipase domain-containing protein n=1 Tax=Callosobruchus maculatus TaxID=64391 RepID=A0A653C065_CALMS|nr:unnamed protein product [Callosobruchus maculatus]
MVVCWGGCLLVFGLLCSSIKCQILPDTVDYQKIPLPFKISPGGELNPFKRQQALSFGACKINLDTKCPSDDITFFLYTKEQPSTAEPIILGSETLESNLRDTLFDPRRPTKIIIHGYNSDMDLSALVEIRKEYLKSQDYNIFTVDWSPLGQAPCYVGALWNIRQVGKCSAQLVERIKELGAEDIHVIGFSLGAHVANFLAVSLRPYRLPRITGLDPALPGFVTAIKDDKLDKTDAYFVDVYHTNAFMQGKAEESGHVDFYVNGGILQPGCWAEPRFFACNHHRAPIYFAETVNTPKGFWGWPCPSYFMYLTGSCPPRDPQVIMGEFINSTSSGVYLVITESVPPYAAGKYEGPNIEIVKEGPVDWQKYENEILDNADELQYLDRAFDYTTTTTTTSTSRPFFRRMRERLQRYFEQTLG